MRKMRNFKRTDLLLYEDSCKLIEEVSPQQAKNSKLKNKLDLVKNEKNSLANELDKVKLELKIDNEDLIKFKEIEKNLNTHP